MKIVDFPMQCCGIVEAEGFGYDTTEAPHLAKIFDLIEETQRKLRRNVALITLVDYQRVAMIAAKERGYGEILKFYNPNSRHYCFILAKVLWTNYAEFELSYGAAKPPKYQRRQQPTRYDVNPDGSIGKIYSYRPAEIFRTFPVVDEGEEPTDLAEEE